MSTAARKWPPVGRPHGEPVDAADKDELVRPAPGPHWAPAVHRTASSLVEPVPLG